MTTGLDDFKSVLGEFRSVSVWAGVSSVSVPFVAAFAGVMPPWPPHIEYITAVFQLIAIMFVYQMFAQSSKSVANRNIKWLAASVIIILFSYVFVFSQFTIHISGNNSNIIIGYQCTKKALDTYADTCPFLTINELKGAQYNEFDLWTRFSISAVRTGITILWCLFFITLSAFIGQFLIFQKHKTLTSRV